MISSRLKYFLRVLSSSVRWLYVSVTYFVCQLISYKKSLAKRIASKAKSYGIDIPETSQLYKYLHEDYIEETCKYPDEVPDDIIELLKQLNSYEYGIVKNGKIVNNGTKKELLNNIDKIKTAKIEIPKIIEFINNVNKKKNINLELTFDIKELMKDIYRNVK